MTITLIILVVFVTYPFIIGLRGVVEFEFRLEVKNLSSEYYTFGIFFVEHSTEDPEYIEQEMTIALFFISFVFIFYKHKDDA